MKGLIWSIIRELCELASKFDPSPVRNRRLIALYINALTTRMGQRWTPIAGQLGMPINNKHDLPVLGTATRGDADILEVKSYHGIDIITPRELWNRLR